MEEKKKSKKNPGEPKNRNLEQYCMGNKWDEIRV